MALPPKFKGHRILLADTNAPTPASGPEPAHTLEIYLDYVCPYSAKLFNTLHTQLLPALTARPGAPLQAPLQILFRHQIQPWHPTSTLTHEAGLAVLRLAPTRFYDFSAALFKAQRDFFDVNVVNEPRNATYRRLAKIAAESAGVDEDEVYKLLAVPDVPAEDGSLNVGNAVTNDLKTVIKMARLVGIHVSPTVLFDGLVVNEISSGWTVEQWVEWLKKNVV
ncbi:hypothetical protein B0H67DRAFT_605335 [Lasiosphaeris hirsuta]|uniref:Thioredoxin-like fold domain-containing protein n=1 Tax=Lasiosphaeris hirsuta TaxID=260670 RepID=A0AA40B9V8_9PEZI|nr:hypothetical protein B0H67DRAFT_605335 [Lasiosphaeris hirsuta]